MQKIGGGAILSISGEFYLYLRSYIFISSIVISSNICGSLFLCLLYFQSTLLFFYCMISYGSKYLRKWFQFFNREGLLYIYCLFSYLSIYFWVVLKYFVVSKKFSSLFLYFQIHWAFSCIFFFASLLFFYFRDIICWCYLVFSFGFHIFLVFTLTP